jgi:hypothetical protein
MLPKSGRFGVAAALLLASLPLSAVAGPMGIEARMGDSGGLLTPYGEYFLVGGGLTNYFETAVKDRVDVGGTWDVRLGFGNRFYVGAEVAYTGSARHSGALGNNIVTNGLEGALRLQYPFALAAWTVEPFVFGGTGWTHFKINSMVRNGSALKDTNDVAVLPVGGGVMLAYNHILLDARFTYRETFEESLVAAADGSAASLRSWSVGASVGYEF